MTGSLIEELSADGLKSEPNSLDSTAGLVDTTTPCRESRLTMRANLPVLPAGRRLEAAQQADSALELRQFPCFDGRKAPVAQRAAGRGQAGHGVRAGSRTLVAHVQEGRASPLGVTLRSCRLRVQWCFCTRPLCTWSAHSHAGRCAAAGAPVCRCSLAAGDPLRAGWPCATTQTKGCGAGGEGRRQRRRWAASGRCGCSGDRVSAGGLSDTSSDATAFEGHSTTPGAPSEPSADQVASSKPGTGSGALEPLKWWCRASQAARTCCSPATTSFGSTLPPPPISRCAPA